MLSARSAHTYWGRDLVEQEENHRHAPSGVVLAADALLDVAVDSKYALSMTAPDELVFQGSGLVRTLPVGTAVRMLAVVAGVKDYEVPPLGRLWAALLEDAFGSLPAFGFSTAPDVGSTIIVLGTVSGWVKEALSDPELVEEMVRERGWIDEVEIVVSDWTPATEVFSAPPR